MTKHSSVTSLVPLTLLWCLVGTEVEAQGWLTKGAPLPQAPQVHQPPPPPKRSEVLPTQQQYSPPPEVQPQPLPKKSTPALVVQQPPPLQKTSQYNQMPVVQPAPQPQPQRSLQYERSQVLPAQQQYPPAAKVQPQPQHNKYTQAPVVQQPPPLQKTSQYNQMPAVQPAPQPQPQRSFQYERSQVLPAQQQDPPAAKVQPQPQHNKYTQAPVVQQPPPLQKTSQYNQMPAVQPALQPQPQRSLQYERSQVLPAQQQYPPAAKVQPQPQHNKYTQAPVVQQPLQKTSQYNQMPGVQPAPQPQPQRSLQYERSQVLPAQQQYPPAAKVQPQPQHNKYTQAPVVQQPPPLQKTSQYNRMPAVQPAPQPQPQRSLQYERSQVLPTQQQYPPAAKVQPQPQPKKYTQTPVVQQPPPLQKTSQYNQMPAVQPAPQPQPQRSLQYERSQVLPVQQQYPPASKFPVYPRTFYEYQPSQEPQVPQPQESREPQQPYQPYQPQQPQQPYQPKQPQQPYQPQQPQQPYQPYQPQQPQQPYQPKQPQQPYQPQQPQQPYQPKQPQQPYQPYQPQQPEQPYQPKQPQQPTSPQAPQPNSIQICEVPGSHRVPCGGPGISAAECEAISCCFDGQQCYFGNAVTVQCTKDAQFIVVVARDATLPNIDLESISLLGGGQACTHVDSNSVFAIYQFPVTACGSVVMEEPGVIIYENRMSSSFEVGISDIGMITRDSSYELMFQCRYIGTSVETVVVELLQPPEPFLPVAALGPINVHMRLANGQCMTKGCNEMDVAYTSYYTEADYPVPKVLREPVYVEVQLLEKTDPMLVLTLGRCWTTASPNPHSLPQWDILIDGCPYRDDRYLSSLIPVTGVDLPGHYRRFLFKMFTFVDPSSMEPTREHVYIHCSTAVCAATPGHSCEPSCFRMKRDVKAVEQRTAEPKVVVSSGPVIMSQPKQ